MKARMHKKIRGWIKKQRERKRHSNRRRGEANKGREKTETGKDKKGARKTEMKKNEAQNRKFITYRNTARREASHSKRQDVVKLWSSSNQ